MAHANMRSRSGKHAARRAEGFAVRRWLAAGAASIGVGAALLGLSLTDAQVGVASAETTDRSSVPSSSEASDDSASTTQVDRSHRRSSKADSEKADNNSDDETDDTSQTEDASAAEDEDEATEEADEQSVDSPADSPVRAGSGRAADEESPSRRSDVDEDAAEQQISSPADGSEESVVLSAPAETSTPLEKLAERKREDVAEAIAALMAAAQSWIAALPVETRVKDDLTAGLFFVRNTFFNQDPEIDAVQLSGQAGGPITGRIDVFDPEGDEVKLRLLRRPSNGTVQLNPDGTYVYTPSEGFDGVDSFAVAAMDTGPRINVFDMFGLPGSHTGVLVNQGAITFAFTYVGTETWSDAAKAALQTGADRLAAYFMVAKPVTLTYKMTGAKTGFASASSPTVSDVPGFSRTVVQNKLITGIDSNGTEFDGEIDFNLTSNWSYDWVVPSTKSDFIGTVMHEMLHTLGFDATIGAAGKNTGRYWTVFDSFVVNRDGAKAINRRFVFDTAFNPNLTGGNGGLYFGGANAVKANGGEPVPLYTPSPWEGGSSVTHLDDDTYTGANMKMMNAYLNGSVIRTLSPIELGILQDLGFRVLVMAQAPATTAA